jgi:lipoprotein-releasing system ATP-binding protein
MSDVVLSLQHIVRDYHQGEQVLHVLDRLNLELRSGEAVALVGPSGSGKTTLLQIAGLLDTPTAGEIFIAGENVTRASDTIRTIARRKYIGFVYQFHHLLPEFSALENVLLPQMIAGTAKAQASERASELLDSLGLSARAAHRPAALSGGEQQRVAIARALAGSPKLLLADEPTGNLDGHTAEEVFRVLMDTVKKSGVAALVATHNLELAKRMDRVVYLENGVLKA